MKKILSIDGGGIRGIIPAKILTYIEETTNSNISTLFDLIAGTSTGGIIALALCCPDDKKGAKHKSKALVDLYITHARDIFFRSEWRDFLSLRGLTDEKYPHEQLEKILHEYFEDNQLNAALTNLLISSYTLENRSPFFFKSWDITINAIEMRQVARATSAAPTYFEPAKIYLTNKNYVSFIDGGVFANNPAMCAYVEAKKIFPEEKDFVVVSLGTGELTRPIFYDEAKNWGKAEWALPILNVVFDGVSDAVDYQLKQLLGDNFYRFQTKLSLASDDMDNVSSANLNALLIEAEDIITVDRKKIDKLIKLLR